MPMFRKKPIEIEAHRWDVTNEGRAESVIDWLADNGCSFELLSSQRGGSPIAIHTLEGVMRAEPGDWIIRGVSGEFYPCKSDIFEATYDPAPFFEAKASSDD